MWLFTDLQAMIVSLMDRECDAALREFKQDAEAERESARNMARLEAEFDRRFSRSHNTQTSRLEEL